MDSITHLFYGGVIAAAIAPREHRRAALLAGMVLNTLPDLDVVPLKAFADPVAQMTWHRGPTHSLLLLPLLAWALWAWFRRRGGRVAAAPRRWFWVFMLTLLAHPLLDAFTVYGTQLLWPLPLAPTMWSSLFIIDPLFMLPWLAAFVIALWVPNRRFSDRALLAGLVLGFGYLGWSLIAKSMIERAADRALAAIGLQNAPRFSVPMPFNTLLWRVVVMTPDGYLEGERSVVTDRGPMRFRAHADDRSARDAMARIPAAARLLWFNHHFAKAEVRDGRLLLTDLRMGAEPDYTFRFVVAERATAAVNTAEGPKPATYWRAIHPEQLSWPWDAAERLPALWTRIWQEPASDMAH
jgi:inner membrane protein